MSAGPASQHYRVRVFVDFWNYTLAMRDADAGFRTDWSLLGGFAGVRVDFSPRRKRRGAPSCPRCHASVDRCPQCGSDYDFLVDFDRGVTLFDIGGLKADLEDFLDAEVDVVPRSCLRDRYRTMVADATPQWAAATPSG